MAFILMKLGPVKFEIRKTAYDRLTQRTSFRWSELKRLGGKSKLHFTGQDNEDLVLSGQIYTSIAGKSGSEFYEVLKVEGAKGEPLTLIDALGKAHGKWVITDLSKNESNFTRDALPRKIEFQVSLKEYL